MLLLLLMTSVGGQQPQKQSLTMAGRCIHGVSRDLSEQSLACGQTMRKFIASASKDATQEFCCSQKRRVLKWGFNRLSRILPHTSHPPPLSPFTPTTFEWGSEKNWMAIEISFQLKIIGRIKLFVSRLQNIFPRAELSTDWNENKQIIVLFVNLHSIDKEVEEESQWRAGEERQKMSLLLLIN